MRVLRHWLRMGVIQRSVVLQPFGPADFRLLGAPMVVRTHPDGLLEGVFRLVSDSPVEARRHCRIRPFTT